LERVTGVRKDDTRSDIYFLGCIYYHMLTGQPPLKRTRDRTHRLSRTRFVRVKPIRKVEPGIPDSVALVVNKAMMLDPTRRYQTPGYMLADLKIAARRLQEQAQATARRDTEVAGGLAGGMADGNGSAYVPPEERPSVMVVESNAVMQDVFRTGFKRAGYRVLLTGDPARAFDRFRENASTAECVVINAQQLGESAVETFNHFGNDSNTSFVPAVLLLDENQFRFKKLAQTAEHRIVLPMPITMKQLREALAKLVASKASS
jgi:serine/threonine-protein kinase